jgi:hypothetical protein
VEVGEAGARGGVVGAQLDQAVESLARLLRVAAAHVRVAEVEQGPVVVLVLLEGGAQGLDRALEVAALEEPHADFGLVSGRGLLARGERARLGDAGRRGEEGQDCGEEDERVFTQVGH